MSRSVSHHPVVIYPRWSRHLSLLSSESEREKPFQTEREKARSILKTDDTEREKARSILKTDDTEREKGENKEPVGLAPIQQNVNISVRISLPFVSWCGTWKAL